MKHHDKHTHAHHQLRVFRTTPHSFHTYLGEDVKEEPVAIVLLAILLFYNQCYIHAALHIQRNVEALFCSLSDRASRSSHASIET